MSLLYVKAAKGLKFSVERKPKMLVSDSVPMAVPDSHYYRKAILDGDLLQLDAKQWADFQASRASAAEGKQPAVASPDTKPVADTAAAPASSAPAAPANK